MLVALIFALKIFIFILLFSVVYKVKSGKPQDKKEWAQIAWLCISVIILNILNS